MFQHEAKPVFSVGQTESHDTVYHCLLYFGMPAGRRFDEIIAIDEPSTEPETEWLRERRLLKLRPSAS